MSCNGFFYPVISYNCCGKPGISTRMAHRLHICHYLSCDLKMMYRSALIPNHVIARGSLSKEYKMFNKLKTNRYNISFQFRTILFIRLVSNVISTPLYFYSGSSDSLSHNSQELKRIDTDIAELKSKIEVCMITTCIAMYK